METYNIKINPLHCIRRDCTYYCDYKLEPCCRVYGEIYGINNNECRIVEHRMSTEYNLKEIKKQERLLLSIYNQRKKRGLNE